MGHDYGSNGSIQCHRIPIVQNGILLVELDCHFLLISLRVIQIRVLTYIV